MDRESATRPGYDADSSEDDTSRHSSIFRADIHVQEYTEHSGSSPDISAMDPDEAAVLSTSLESCSTLVPNVSDPVDIDYVDSGAIDIDDPKAEPLFIYASPREPVEQPPSMPAPPAQRRAEALAEILFRQDLQTYGLHVSTSTAAMSYIRRSEYHEALRATEFNFRAVQSQQRAYGDLRNHPFYRAAREDTPLLRSGAWVGSEDERTRRRQQRRSRSVGRERAEGSHGSWEAGMWGGLLTFLCCITIPINDYTRDTASDWW
ncbi:hypothetical protein TWF730_004648 [Orbilia blumenaviensis]|uniref:Uncharacterized protein n=1 Tax=Orbilia blumenaviensis TaxID=1796055 RepID=A0AAV9TYG7_9PEZI